MSTHHFPTRAAGFMAERDGVASSEELLELGLTADQRDYQVRSGVLVVRHVGVYRHAAHPATFRGEVRAAILAAPAMSFVSGPSLMRLRGVRGWWDPTPEVTTVGTQPCSLAGVRVRRLDGIYADDGEWRFGLPLLSMELGLVLLGAVVSRSKVLSAVHDARRLGLVSRESLELVAERYGGRG